MALSSDDSAGSEFSLLKSKQRVSFSDIHHTCTYIYMTALAILAVDGLGSCRVKAT